MDEWARGHDALRGAVTVQASPAFGRATQALRWDLTAVPVSGEYPAAEQAAGYARLPYGYGSGAHKQGRYRQVTTTDGAVPVGAQPGEGPTPAGATVLASVRALREPARGTAFVLMGDRKLLAATNRPARLAAERGYLASLARPPAWDAAVRALAAEPFPPVAGVSARDRARPAAERASHPGWETPTASGGTGAAKAAPRWLGRRGG